MEFRLRDGVEMSVLVGDETGSRFSTVALSGKVLDSLLCHEK